MSDADLLAHQWVKRSLRSEMVKHGLTYADLAERLVTVGLVEEEVALRNRVSRGAFSAAFYFQCLAVIGTKTVAVELLDYIIDNKSTKKGRHTSGGGR